jgi:hypothetical protein
MDCMMGCISTHRRRETTMPWVIKHTPTGEYLKDAPYRHPQDVVVHDTKQEAEKDIKDSIHAVVRGNYTPVKIRRKK